MRKLAAVVVALAVVAAGSPALLGALTQGRIAELAEAASAGQYFRVAVTGYERGWRTGRASLSVALSERYKALLDGPFSQSPAAAELPPEIQNLLDWELQLTADLTHGPLLSQGGVGFGLADAAVRVDPATEGLDEMLDSLGIQSPGEIVARIGFASVSPFSLAIPPMTYTGQAGTFASSGLIGEGSYNMTTQRLATQSRLDSLEMTMQGAAFRMEDFAVSGDMRAIAAGVWSGSTDVVLGNLSATGPDNSPIATLDTLSARIRNAVNETGDRADAQIELSVDSATGFMGADEQTISGLSLIGALRNLNVAAMLEYRDAFLDLVEMDVATNDPTAFLAAVQPIIYDLLAAEPELEYGPLSFNWNGGALQARIVVRIDNEMLPAEPLFSLLETGIWPRLVAVEAELDIDRNIAEWIAVQVMSRQGATPTDFIPAQESAAVLQAQARGTLVALTAQGMLEETESGYRFQGSYENGLVEVNGQIVPIGPAAQGQF